MIHFFSKKGGATGPGTKWGGVESKPGPSRHPRALQLPCLGTSRCPSDEYWTLAMLPLCPRKANCGRSAGGGGHGGTGQAKVRDGHQAARWEYLAGNGLSNPTASTKTFRVPRARDERLPNNFRIFFRRIVFLKHSLPGSPPPPTDLAAVLSLWKTNDIWHSEVGGAPGGTFRPAPIACS